MGIRQSSYFKKCVIPDYKTISNRETVGVMNPYAVNNNDYEDHVDRMYDPRF